MKYGEVNFLNLCDGKGMKSPKHKPRVKTRQKLGFEWSFQEKQELGEGKGCERLKWSELRCGSEFHGFQTKKMMMTQFLQIDI